MSAQNKDVVYVDIDDEITGVIEKVRDSSAKIVALVLPKRATVMQSIVNMKLLKRTAGEAKKSIVLITSETALLPLAGIAGLHVAKTLQSKPEVPDAPVRSDALISVDDDEVDEVPAAAIDPQKSVGELAGLSATDDDTIEVDDDDEPADAAAAGAVAGAAKAKKTSYNKKLRIPNFDTFRTRLFLIGGGLLLLIGGYVLAFFILPKATITIKTDNLNVNTSLAMTASVDVKKLDEKQSIVPAISKQFKKTDTQKAPATGQKDQGTKATGKVTLSLSDCAEAQVTVPAGTVITANNLNFVTTADATMNRVLFGNQCRNSDFPEVSTDTVAVAAQGAGGQYNLSARAYSVTGFANVSGYGSAMTGGTSKMVTVVSQQDVDNAKQKILDGGSAATKQDLTNQLKAEGYLALGDTMTASDPLVTASPNVDTEAPEVTVTVAVTYTLTGAKQTDIQKLVEADIKKHIDATKQNILSNGLDKAVVAVTDKNPKALKFTVQTVALAGVQQDSESIKQSVVGKKKGEVQSIIKSRPGVQDVNVEYHPFWVYSTPSSTSKLTVIFEQSNGTITNKK